MKKICVLFGTRPEALKLVPVIKGLEKCPEVALSVAVTAQHREMLDQVLHPYGIEPAHDLGIMRGNQDLTYITSAILSGVGDLLEKERPDFLLVQGDTTTTFASALAAFYRKIPIGHVEAGLRTQDKYRPFPEEINRRMVSALADLHFAPTPSAKERLLAEGLPAERILVTGNTIVDMLFLTLERINEIPPVPPPFLGPTAEGKKLILVTGHRRESFGEGFENICHAFKRIVERHPEVEIVYPVHLNPNVQVPVRAILEGVSRVHLVPPLDYVDFVSLMRRCDLVLTDSGGIQEEAPSLGKPVLVMRELTERTEGIEAGTARLVGTDCERIVAETDRLLTDRSAYERMSRAENPYGDGKASGRIIGAVLRFLSEGDPGKR